MTAREIILDGGSPWGFRMHGGVDVLQPLRISRVSHFKKICPILFYFFLAVLEKHRRKSDTQRKYAKIPLFIALASDERYRMSFVEVRVTYV